MNTNLLKNIKGYWKYQQTVYSIRTKKITNYKNLIKIKDLNLANQNIYKIEYKNLESLLSIIYAEDKIIINKDCTKIIYRIINNKSGKTKIFYDNKKIQFEEVFYSINVNFFLVIGIFKYYNKYIYTSVTSFIKVL